MVDASSVNLQKYGSQAFVAWVQRAKTREKAWTSAIEQPEQNTTPHLNPPQSLVEDVRILPPVIFHIQQESQQTKHEQPINVNRQDEDGNTALHFAAFDGEHGYTRLLVAVGADVNLANRRGDTPLICAAYNGHCNVIMTLSAGGADLEATDEEGRSALTWAVIRGHLDAVRLLLSLGAKTHIVDRVDNTPLHWAVILNHRAICNLLIAAEE